MILSDAPTNSGQQLFEMSTKKHALLLAGLLLFIVAGVLLVFDAERFSSPLRANVVGWLALTFFGAVFLIIVTKLARLQRHVYRITKQGITLFNISDEEIKWRDIEAVSEMKARNTRLIVLKFTLEFAAKRKNLLSRRSVSMGATMLKADFQQLSQAVKDAHQAFHSKTSPQDTD